MIEWDCYRGAFLVDMQVTGNVVWQRLRE